MNLHMNADYFPEPNQFIPERFSVDNIDKIPKGAYIPFSLGPRMCIGDYYTFYNISIEVYRLLDTFERTELLFQDGVQLSYVLPLFCPNLLVISVM